MAMKVCYLARPAGALDRVHNRANAPEKAESQLYPEQLSPRNPVPGSLKLRASPPSCLRASASKPSGRRAYRWAARVESDAEPNGPGSGVPGSLS